MLHGPVIRYLYAYHRFRFVDGRRTQGSLYWPSPMQAWVNRRSADATAPSHGCLNRSSLSHLGAYLPWYNSYKLAQRVRIDKSKNIEMKVGLDIILRLSHLILNKSFQSNFIIIRNRRNIVAYYVIAFVWKTPKHWFFCMFSVVWRQIKESRIIKVKIFHLQM